MLRITFLVSCIFVLGSIAEESSSYYPESGNEGEGSGDFQDPAQTSSDYGSSSGGDVEGEESDGAFESSGDYTPEGENEEPDCIQQHCSYSLQNCASEYQGCGRVLQEFMDSGVCEQVNTNTAPYSQCYDPVLQLEYCESMAVDGQATSCFDHVSALAACHATNCDNVQESDCVWLECQSEINHCLLNPECDGALTQAMQGACENCDQETECCSPQMMCSSSNCELLWTDLGACYHDHCAIADVHEQTSNCEGGHTTHSRKAIKYMMKNKKNEKQQIARLKRRTRQLKQGLFRLRRNRVTKSVSHAFQHYRRNKRRKLLNKKFKSKKSKKWNLGNLIKKS